MFGNAGGRTSGHAKLFRYMKPGQNKWFSISIGAIFSSIKSIKCRFGLLQLGKLLPRKLLRFGKPSLVFGGNPLILSPKFIHSNAMVFTPTSRHHKKTHSISQLLHLHVQTTFTNMSTQRKTCWLQNCPKKTYWSNKNYLTTTRLCCYRVNQPFIWIHMGDCWVTTGNHG